MKLDAARLCLDCEEIHDEQNCPACSSEVFAFLTRWIEPASEPRLQTHRSRTAAAERRRQAVHADPEQVEVYRQLLSADETPRRTGLLTKSMLGLAAFGLAGWFVRAAASPRPETAARKGEGTRDKGQGEPTAGDATVQE